MSCTRWSVGVRSGSTLRARGCLKERAGWVELLRSRGELGRRGAATAWTRCPYQAEEVRDRDDGVEVGHVDNARPSRRHPRWSRGDDGRAPWPSCAWVDAMSAGVVVVGERTRLGMRMHSSRSGRLSSRCGDAVVSLRGGRCLGKRRSSSRRASAVISLRDTAASVEGGSHLGGRPESSGWGKESTRCEAARDRSEESVNGSVDVLSPIRAGMSSIYRSHGRGRSADKRPYKCQFKRSVSAFQRRSPDPEEAITSE